MNRHGTQFAWAWVAVSLAALGLSACGFYLRGAIAVPEHLRAVYLEGVNPYSEFGAELGAALRGNGLTVLERREDAQLVLAVSNLRFERRVFQAMFALEDQKEGMTAFSEKRTPQFRNK